MKKLIITFILFASPVTAQVIHTDRCASVDVPTQVPLLNTSITVPANNDPNFYPIILEYQTDLSITSISLMTWNHIVPAGIPLGTIQFRGYISRFPIPEGQAHNGLVTDMLANDGTGLPKNFAMSKIIARNEAYLVWIGNSLPHPVDIHFSLTARICKD